MKLLVPAICSVLPLFVEAAELKKIDFTEYNNNVARLSLECKSRGKPCFNGICLSSTYDDQSSTSINIALEVSSFEMFYRTCEHSDSPKVESKAREILDIQRARQFYDEMSGQQDALVNYSRNFAYCRTPPENDATISKKMRWFEYMTSKYSGSTANANSIVAASNPILKYQSNHDVRSVVGCILEQYRGPEFFATGIPNKDGSITLQLVAPEMRTLATVSSTSSGSATEYLNVKNKSNNVIPQAETFDAAIRNCQ